MKKAGSERSGQVGTPAPAVMIERIWVYGSATVGDFHEAAV